MPPRPGCNPAAGPHNKKGYTMTTVTIYHNIATDEVGRCIAMLDGYEPGHPLVPVHQYKEAIHRTDDRILEAAFYTFNEGTGEHAERYRNRLNRSLSVGDVVRIDDGTGEPHSTPYADWKRYYSCESTGWKRIDAPRWFARKASMRGTTAMVG
jgi:hypothetical protein